MGRDYGIMIPSWPATLGADGAGVVESVGEDVKSFKQGDEVLAQFTPGNNKSAAFQVCIANRSFLDSVKTSQSCAAVDASKVGRKPASWSFDDTTSLPYVSLPHFSISSEG